MKRLFVIGATVIVGWLGAGQASADVPQLSAGKDDAVCIAVDNVIGLCQGSPVPFIEDLLDKLPR